MPDTLAGMEFVNILHHLPDYFHNKKRSSDVVYILEDTECGEYFEYFRQPPELLHNNDR